MIKNVLLELTGALLTPDSFRHCQNLPYLPTTKADSQQTVSVDRTTWQLPDGKPAHFMIIDCHESNTKVKPRVTGLKIMVPGISSCLAAAAALNEPIFNCSSKLTHS